MGLGLGWAVILALLVSLSATLAAPFREPAVASLVLGWGLLTLAAADLAAMRLPDVLTLPLTGAGLAVKGLDLATTPLHPAFSAEALAPGLAGAAAGYLALAGLAYGYRSIRGRDGLGLGDAKLAACAGAWLGWRPLPLVVLLACGVAFAWIAVRLVVQGRGTLREPLAFGAPLALAIWLCWLARADLWLGLG